MGQILDIDPSTKLTFKQVSRGFRCNQTHVKVKNCFNHERLITNRGRKPFYKIPEYMKDLPKVKLSADNTWECPASHGWSLVSKTNHNGRVGNLGTCRCGKEVYLI
jgi:hypothetical protein